jgi:biopolymer transport protein ExbB/TolQ
MENISSYTIEPYNYYILLGAFILSLLFWIILAIHLLKLSHTMQKNSEKIKQISDKAKLVQIKAEVLQENNEAKKAQSKKYAWLLPIVLALLSNYREDKTSHGFKRVKNAVHTTAVQNKHDRKMVRSITKVINQ